MIKKALAVIGGLGAVGLLGYILTRPPPPECIEGETRKFECPEGIITQKCVEGKWYPPCPEEVEITITVEEE